MLAALGEGTVLRLAEGGGGGGGGGEGGDGPAVSLPMLKPRAKGSVMAAKGREKAEERRGKGSGNTEGSTPATASDCPTARRPER